MIPTEDAAQCKTEAAKETVLDQSQNVWSFLYCRYGEYPV
ncbi:MAG: hypothetical protein JWL77_4126 [Chthonomonadaceae bacterium]|nr:hypothetical protein [Chthonomonadaceae bacterium]